MKTEYTTAISPSLWLILSNLIILEKPIFGYNSKFRISTSDMKVRSNTNVNYFLVVVIIHHKKGHQDQAPLYHLETLDKR